MGENSKIEWTDHTFNPWWGCEKVSPACLHCYAETWAKRCGEKVWGRGEPRRFFGEKHWAEPLKWNAAAEKAGVRKRVFCASMADVCEDRPDLVVERARLVKLIEATPHLDWLLLTKRPENFRELFFSWGHGVWPANVWVGTTVEDQKRADERIPELLKINAIVRFLSCEPLLEEVDLRRCSYCGSSAITDHVHTICCDHCGKEFGGVDLRGWGGESMMEGLHWVICGGESGPGARPMHPDWARSMRDQCAAAGVPFLFKQWGAWCPAPEGSTEPIWNGIDGEFEGARLTRAPRSGAGRLLDGREWNGFPGKNPTASGRE